MKILRILSWTAFLIVNLNKGSYSQENYIIISDEITDNYTYYSLLTLDSIFINSYIGKTPSIAYDDLQYIWDYSTNPVTSFGDDILVNSFWIPEMMTGCLPEDICYNPNNQDLYIYGGRRILVMDGASHQIIDSITVNEAGKLWYYNIIDVRPREKLALNIEDNVLFCAAPQATILAIDCDNNEIIDSYQNPEFENIVFSKVIYQNETENAYWLLTQVLPIIKSSISKIKIVQGDIIIEQELFPSSLIFYDFELNPGGTKLYVSHPQSFNILNTEDFSLEDQFIMNPSTPPGSIKYNRVNDLIYVDLQLSGELLVYDSYNNPVTTITQQLNTINYIELDYEKNMLFCSAYQQTEIDIYDKGIETIDCNDNMVNNMKKLYGFAFGSIYHNVFDKGYLGTGSEIIEVRGGTGSNAFGTVNTGRRSVYRLTQNEQTGNLFAVNLTGGGVIEIDENNDINDFIQIGGGISEGCYNSIKNKVYFIQDMGDWPDYESGQVSKSFFLSIDCQSGTYDTTQFCSKGVDCAFDAKTNKFFIAEFNNRILVVDGTNEEIINQIPIDANYDIYRIKSFSDGSLFISSKDKIFIYDGASLSLLNMIQVDGGINQFIKDTKNNEIIAANNTNNQGYKIYIFDNGSNLLIDEIALDYEPLTLTIDEQYRTIFCGHRMLGPDYISIIDRLNHNIEVVSFPYTVKKLFFNNRNSTLYALCNEGIALFRFSTKGYELVDFIEIGQINIDFIYNPFNNSFYIYTVEENLDLAINVVECTSNTLSSNVKLNQKTESFFVSMFGFDNLVLNTTNNVLYCGNLGLSNISVIGCSSEQRTLLPGINWISFPRLDRNNQNNEPVEAIPLLEYIIPFPTSLRIENIPPNYPPPPNYLEYNGGAWSQVGGLNYLFSTRGYKLYTNNFSESILHCDGTILSSQVTMDLYGPGKENWIGYFLAQSCWAEDAFAEVWDCLTLIKTQYWTMAKIDGEWIVSSKVGPLVYGDMVIVKCTTDCSFHWNQYASAGTPKDYRKTTYFTYQELADYTPVFVELDTLDQPLEIGIFNDSICLGAETVNPGDTMIQINAYVDSTGQQLEFEFYYGTKNAPASHPDYRVYNPVAKRMEDGKIKTSNKNDWYWVSFRNILPEDGQVSDQPVIDLNYIKSNPFSEKTEIAYTLHSCTVLSIHIIALDGRNVARLIEGNQCQGFYSIEWNGMTSLGKRAPPGLYLLKIETPIQSITEKLIYFR